MCTKTSMVVGAQHAAPDLAGGERSGLLSTGRFTTETDADFVRTGRSMLRPYEAENEMPARRGRLAGTKVGVLQISVGFSEFRGKALHPTFYVVSISIEQIGHHFIENACFK